MQGPRYLLVGGSNCLITEGFGARLVRRLPGVWNNQSLGSSSSLRGLDFLLTHPDLAEQADVIVFEYALNDLIFETGGTLDPLVHRHWLQVLASQPALSRKLRFVLLCGRAATRRVAAGESAVVDHYRAVGETFGIPVIDLMDDIAQAVAAEGDSAVFKDHDHFTELHVDRLVARAALALAQAAPGPAAPSSSQPGAMLVGIDPLDEGERTGVQAFEYRTRLVSARLARLSAGASLTFESPGGLLVGFYAVCGGDAAAVRLTHRGHDRLKILRQRGRRAKSYLALSHLTAPIPTREGERITVRQASDPYGVPGATLDPTQGQRIEASPADIEFGRFLFLAPAP